MDITLHTSQQTLEIPQLFQTVFTDSEGKTEGEMIGQLVERLFTTTPTPSLFCFTAIDVKQLVGAIIFTRLDFSSHGKVFLLAPVCVRSDRHGQGIGQLLIKTGINELRNIGADAIITYGDPKFYGKVGFHSVSPQKIKAPYELSQPEGWLGLSLTEDYLETLSGQAKCVSAFENPIYW